MIVTTAKTRWKDVILVCRKCSKKLDGGGFGPHGDKTLKKALKTYLRSGDNRKADLTVKHTDCFDICPKNAVVAVNATNPKALLIVPAGAGTFEGQAGAGLGGRRALEPAPKTND